MQITDAGQMVIEVRHTVDPVGRPAVLIQLPQGWVTLHRAEDIDQVAQALTEAAGALRERGGEQ